MFRMIVILLVTLLGAHGATAQPAATKKTEKKTEARRSVGVISAIGHKFALQKIGIMVFGNELKEVAIDAWGIDDLVAAKVGAVLGAGYDVRRVPAPAGAFDALTSPGSIFRDGEADLRQIVARLAANQKADFYLVVTRGGSQFGSTNQFVTGLGLVAAGGPLLSNPHLYALSVMHLYDGKTFALVRRQIASIGQPTFLAIIKGPHRAVDQSWWPESPQLANNDKLKTAVRTLVEQSVAMTTPEIMATKTPAARTKEIEAWSPFKQ